MWTEVLEGRGGAFPGGAPLYERYLSYCRLSGGRRTPHVTRLFSGVGQEGCWMVREVLLLRHAFLFNGDSGGC